jgi:hypothetical protein
MENKWIYSFDDEPVRKFCYDIENNKIEVHFSSCFDNANNQNYDQPCVFVIEKWKEAKSKIGDDEKQYEINKHIGIFSMILYMNWQHEELEMLVSTLDNRYVSLLFKGSKLSLK